MNQHLASSTGAGSIFIAHRGVGTHPLRLEAHITIEQQSGIVGHKANLI